MVRKKTASKKVVSKKNTAKKAATSRSKKGVSVKKKTPTVKKARKKTVKKTVKKAVKKSTAAKKKSIKRTTSVKKAARKSAKKTSHAGNSTKKKDKTRVKSQASASIRTVKSGNRREKERYTVYLAASGGDVIESETYRHSIISDEKTNPDISFGTVERIHHQPHQTEDVQFSHPVYTNEMLTDHLMNYFIQSGVSHLHGEKEELTSKHLDPEEVHVESLDLEIRNNLSDIVMALLKREEQDRLYGYMVEYKEFIRDIMNLLK